MTYLGFPTGDWRVWPRPMLEDDRCLECGRHPRAWGDWVCARCRRGIEDERVGEGSDEEKARI